jgi:hypothetical protein
LSLFKQFPRSTTYGCSKFDVSRVLNRHLRIGRIELSAGKSVEAAQERELVAALYQKDFGVVRVSVVAEQNYGCCVFWRSGCHLARDRFFRFQDLTHDGCA